MDWEGDPEVFLSVLSMPKQCSCHHFPDKLYWYSCGLGMSWECCELVFAFRKMAVATRLLALFMSFKMGLFPLYLLQVHK